MKTQKESSEAYRNRNYRVQSDKFFKSSKTKVSKRAENVSRVLMDKESKVSTNTGLRLIINTGGFTGTKAQGLNCTGKQDIG